MKKKIKLTEDELTRMISKIIKEEKEGSDNVDDMKKEIMGVFRKVASPDFGKGTFDSKNKSIKQIKSEIRDILERY